MRDQGRPTVGVWGIDLQDADYVVAMVVVDSAAMLLVAGANGMGKRTSFEEYRSQTRGGKGIITMRTSDKSGQVVGALTVHDGDELMLTTNKGQTVRTRVEEIRETGRNATGVKLMDLPKNVKLQDIARMVSQTEEGEVPASESPAEGEAAAGGEPA